MWISGFRHPSKNAQIITQFKDLFLSHQVRQATLANYSAVIVYNVGSNKLVPMAGSDDTLIPSVFMGGDDAQVYPLQNKNIIVGFITNYHLLSCFAGSTRKVHCC